MTTQNFQLCRKKKLSARSTSFFATLCVSKKSCLQPSFIYSLYSIAIATCSQDTEIKKSIFFNLLKKRSSKRINLRNPFFLLTLKVADCKKFCMNINRNNLCNIFFKKRSLLFPFGRFVPLSVPPLRLFRIVFCSSTKLLTDYSNPHPGIASNLPFLKLREEHSCYIILIQVLVHNT